jgi:isopentenyl diphosphate isomerase/L-lactate dehydrogenase-like FMN-dependent dehydrogenase
MADFMMIDNMSEARPGGFRSLYEMVQQAEDRMVKGEWELVGLAAASGASLRRNRLGFESLAFRQRVLRDVSDLDISTTLLGHTLTMPVMICPMGGLHLTVGPDAVLNAARAAATVGIPIATSSSVEPAIEVIGPSTEGVKFYQLYISGDAGYLGERIGRAKAAGYRAIIITADAPFFSIRDYPNKSRNFRLPAKESGKEFGAKATWDTLDEIRRMAAPLPVILKGIQTPEDATIAIDHGIDAIVVSNHGGRELDYCDATIAMLPDIAATVAGRIPVLLDSGIRRGTDVVKALALGADAVGIGRLAAWSMAAGGEPAVQRMLELLGAEIGNTMGLLGVTSIKELDPSYLKHVPPLAGYYPEFRLRDIQPI